MIFGLGKKREVTVGDSVISVQRVNGDDYLCLTDMARGDEGTDQIKNWMRTRETLEFLGLWESINNPDFKPVEFDRFKKEAGLNKFTMRPQKWVEATGAIGIFSKSGRYGGTYAHRDIAFEFGSWISASFKLYLIQSYQKLLKIETNEHNIEWNVQRVLSKTNYQLHTDAIKQYVIPNSRRFWNPGLEYAEGADLLSVAVFGYTAKEWRDANPERAKAGGNMRDSASINELNVLANLQSHHAELMHDGVLKEERFKKLKEIADRQLEALNRQNPIKSVKKLTEETYLAAHKPENEK